MQKRKNKKTKLPQDNESLKQFIGFILGVVVAITTIIKNLFDMIK